jgi:hypothetical protein
MASKICVHCQHIRPLQDFTLRSGQEGKQCRICRDITLPSCHLESDSQQSPEIPSKACSQCKRILPLDQFRPARGSRETKQCQQCRDRVNRSRLRAREASPEPPVSVPSQEPAQPVPIAPPPLPPLQGPQPPPLHRDSLLIDPAVSDTEWAMIERFHNHLRTFSMENCTSYHRRWFNIKLRDRICEPYRKDPRPHSISLFSKENNMQPDDIPPELP